MDLSQLKEKASSLPVKPGVYLMLDAAGRVIYVGKAKALKNRVSQYFQDTAGHSFKTASMVAQVRDFDVILTGTEFEALVLECSLIKRHMPKYNILLKDDKGYPYIRLSENEQYPRFSLVSKPAAHAARYFGPYGGRNETRAVIDAIRTALKLPNCSRKFPRDIGRDRPCLNRHMGLWDAYCLPPGDTERYRAAVEQAVLILEGKYEELRARLAGEMEQAAEELRFERAAELRDRLRAIESLGKQQHVVAGTRADTDVIGFFRGEVKSCLAVLCYVGGDLVRRDAEVFDTPAEEEPEELLSAAVSLYYLGRSRFPKEVLLPFRMEDAGLIERMLQDKAGRKVNLLVPERGRKRALVLLAQQNASEEAERATTGEERTSRLLLTLQKMLDLERPRCGLRPSIFPIPRGKRWSLPWRSSGTQSRCGAITGVFGSKRLRDRMIMGRWRGPDAACPPDANGGDSFGAAPDLITDRRGRGSRGRGWESIGTGGGSYPRLWNGKGRQAPDSCSCDARGAGNRNPGEPGHFRPDRTNSGRNASLCRGVSPPAPREEHDAFGVGRDSRRGRKKESGAPEAV